MASNANLIRVYVRARPLLKNEKSQKIDEKFLSLDGTHVELQNILRKKSQYIDNIQSKFQFTVDSTFDAEATNQQVFNQTTRPLIERVLDGYNGTVFCYGATNSGKTHTMIGKLQSEINQNAIGLYTQAAEMIFQRVNETSQQRIYLVSASFIEFYNDQINDLLYHSSIDQQQQSNIPPKSPKSPQSTPLFQDPFISPRSSNISNINQSQQQYYYFQTQEQVFPSLYPITSSAQYFSSQYSPGIQIQSARLRDEKKDSLYLNSSPNDNQLSIVQQPKIASARQSHSIHTQLVKQNSFQKSPRNNQLLNPQSSQQQTSQSVEISQQQQQQLISLNLPIQSLTSQYQQQANNDKLNNLQKKQQQYYQQQQQQLDIVDIHQDTNMYGQLFEGTIIPWVTEVEIKNESQLNQLIVEGNKKRKKAETGRNLLSSRSHAVLIIKVQYIERVKDNDTNINMNNNQQQQQQQSSPRQFVGQDNEQ